MCFPCLEKLTAKFTVFPVPWSTCTNLYSTALVLMTLEVHVGIEILCRYVSVYRVM